MPSILKCEVFRITTVGPTPGSHSLDTVDAFGNPAIVKRGAFKPGDLAVYIPENAIVPLTDARFSFLKSARIRPIKLLKGTVYSEGLVIPAEPGWKEGDDVREALGITKWEPEEPVDIRGHVEKPRTVRQKVKQFIFERILGFGDANEKDPGIMPVYGVDNYRKYKGALVPGERVIVTEKIHGMNFRAVYVPSEKPFRRLLAKVLLAVGFARASSRVGGKLYVGSHERVKARAGKSVFWQVAIANGLDEKLAQAPGFVFYGEVFGHKVQKNYDYGAETGQQFLRFFDAYNTQTRRYANYDGFKLLCDTLGLTRTPVLYDGPFEPEKVEPHRLGKSTVGGAHIREGVVIGVASERVDPRIGRVKLKLVSEDYKIGNLDGTEFH